MMISFLLSPMGILFFGGSLLMGATLLHTHGKGGNKKREEESLSADLMKKETVDPREEKLHHLENLLVQKEESLKNLITTASETTEQLDRMIRRFEDTFYAKDAKSPSISMIFSDLRSSLNGEVSDLRSQLEKGPASRESRKVQQEKAA